MSRKSGKQTKVEKAKETDQQAEDLGPYDGLVGEFPTDYVTVCERNGVVPMGVEVNASAPGPYITVVTREDSEPGSVDELIIADTDLSVDHIEPLQLALEVGPSPLDTLRVLRASLSEGVLQGLSAIARKKNLKKFILDGCHLPLCLSPVFSTPAHHVSMKCCSLTDRHCVDIGKGVAHNHHIGLLNLACNRIADQGAREIVKGLRLNRSLLILSLTNNYIGDSGAADLAEMLTEFPLTHEEVVLRRQLLCGGGEGGEERLGGGVDTDLSASLISPKTSTSGASPDKLGRNSKMEKGKPGGAGGKKDQGKKDDKSKKEDPKKRNSVGGKGVGKVKDAKGGKKAGGDMAPDTPTPPDLPKIANPLIEHVIEDSGPLRMAGNQVLVSLSLAYNHLTDKGVQLLLTAMNKQDTGSEKGRGLLRLSVRNSRVSQDCLSELSRIIEDRDPLTERPGDQPPSTGEEQGPNGTTAE